MSFGEKIFAARPTTHYFCDIRAQETHLVTAIFGYTLQKNIILSLV